MYASRCLAASSTRITRCGSKNGMTITACASALAMVAKALRNSLGPPISIGSNRRPALVTAKRRSSTKGPLYGVVVGVVGAFCRGLSCGFAHRDRWLRLVLADKPDSDRARLRLVALVRNGHPDRADHLRRGRVGETIVA